jgi:hypothetical protein
VGNRLPTGGQGEGACVGDVGGPLQLPTRKPVTIPGFQRGIRKADEISGPLPPADLMPDLAAAKGKLRLLWLACGNKDGLMRISQGVHAYLKEKDVPHVWHVDSHGHDATEWGKNFYLFSQRIFK